MAKCRSHQLALSGSDMDFTQSCKTAAIFSVSLSPSLTDTIFSNMGVLGCLVSTWMFACPPWNSLCAFDWEEEPIVCMEMELTDENQGRQEQSWSPIGSGTRLWLTSWQGREAQRSYWIYHGTKWLWFISVNLLLWLEIPLTLRKVSCALASGPQWTEWLEQREEWRRYPISCARSWRSSSGFLHFTGSAESQPESSSKGTWMRAVNPFCQKYSAVFSFETFLRTFLGVSWMVHTC